MREKLSSRLGFLMLTAGCAVGLGNVWRFPFVVGENGGAAFVVVYLVFLLLLGFPLLTAELALGRASGRGISGALGKLSSSGGRFWTIAGTVIFSGNALLMLYYTDVGGWLVQYAGHYAVSDAPPRFGRMVSDRSACAIAMAAVVIVASGVCAAGVRRGVEAITKWMMVSLLALLGVLAVKALSLEGAAEGLEFYLKPDWSKIAARPWKTMCEAMGQAFFTLSVGVGCMTIFGSYIGREGSLVRESAVIVFIDTLVAFVSGLIIFPACTTYGVAVNSGPGLIFEALPTVFAEMPSGRIWGGVFFLFLSLAALTTVIAVFECLIGGLVDEWKIKRSRAAMLVGALVAAGSLPTVFIDGVLKAEDLVFSRFYLPLGALAICVFVSWNPGWGFDNFRCESSDGKGADFPESARFWMRWVIPAMILVIICASF